jgi:isocitrate dehydrogenase
VQAPSQPPPDGRPITLSTQGALVVPTDPAIPFIAGDGIGADVWRAARKVVDTAVARAYGRERRIAWLEGLAGQRAHAETGEWLPQATIDALRRYLVGVKGPLATPVGSGIRSLNIALRRALDLYAAVRPIAWLPGVPAPIREPEAIDVVLFRENVEDVHTGLEWPAKSEEAHRLIRFLQDEMEVRALRFPDTTALGIKPSSRQGAERLIRAAIDYALTHGRSSVTFVHKGEIMKFTEGAFADWALELARNEYRGVVVTDREADVLRIRERAPALGTADIARELEPGYDGAPSDRQAELRAEVDEALAWAEGLTAGEHEQLLLVRAGIVDSVLQRALRHPAELDVIASLNLTGDYLADVLAAQVGGSAVIPGVSLNYVTGHALFEAQHGTAPRHAGQDRANPTSMILCGEMLLRHLDWTEAAERIRRGLLGAIASEALTADLAAFVPGAEPLGCSAFADAVIECMEEGPPTVPRTPSTKPDAPAR